MLLEAVDFFFLMDHAVFRMSALGYCQMMVAELWQNGDRKSVV